MEDFINNTVSEIWKDTEGNAINAHGGSMLFHNGVYYWYGEIKSGKTHRVFNPFWENYRVDAGGISCYSSTDLCSWKFHGVALSPDRTNKRSELHITKVIERPRVIYNPLTQKFVMWMHIDSQQYLSARAGVAISDSPIGLFYYQGSTRPNGNTARDATIFQDDNGQAYHFYSSERNRTMYVCLLEDDYLSHTAKEKRILIDQRREAPAVFKYDNRYYLITSGCTGWEPNMPSCEVTWDIMNDWYHLGNPYVGDLASFTVQGSHVAPIQGHENKFIFMADQWHKTDLAKSRYLWLPLHVRNGRPKIEWKDKWQML